jgi:CubicO group peptidase (beta-lactamase class C family)
LRETFDWDSVPSSLTTNIGSTMNDQPKTVSPAPQVAPIGSPEETGLSPGGLAKLTAIMQREIDARRLPGVSMMIARGGKVGYRRDLGVLRPGGPIMPGDAIFRIYSMTKPIVSVALMMLVEDGRLFIADPVAKYIPEFADPKVGVEKDGKLELVPAKRPITVQDLLRHTSGLTYEFTGESAVQRLYGEARLFRDLPNAELVTELAKLPLLEQPGVAWHYSHSTDVIGRIIEVISGQTLGAFLRERLFAPLGMSDTGFFAPADKHERLAEAFPNDPDTGAAVELINVRAALRLEMGGGGLVSTMDDYARFLLMLYRGGTLGAARILGRKTIAFMTADHLGPEVRIGTRFLLAPGHGFGLGFAVRRDAGMAPTPGTVGEYFWGGIAGTAFWIAPQEELIALMMIQAPGQRDYYRQLFRFLMHAALA